MLKLFNRAHLKEFRNRGNNINFKCEQDDRLKLVCCYCNKETICFHEFENFEEDNLYINEAQAMQICEICCHSLLVEEDTERFDEKKAKKKLLHCDFTGCNEVFTILSDLEKHNEIHFGGKKKKLICEKIHEGEDSICGKPF